MTGSTDDCGSGHKVMMFYYEYLYPGTTLVIRERLFDMKAGLEMRRQQPGLRIMKCTRGD